jgi:hypothetical protein
MSAGSTQAHHGNDQENMPKTSHSPAGITRAFGVVLGPSLLLDLFLGSVGVRRKMSWRRWHLTPLGHH